MSNADKIRQVAVLVEKEAQKLLSTENTRKFAEFGADIIRKRTRLGYGVAQNGGSRFRLKPLADSYIQQRRGQVIFYKDKNGKVRRVPVRGNIRPRKKLSDKTTPGKSNLTFTAQMLDSIQGKVTGPGRGQIEPTGTRDDGESNQTIAQYAHENGRPFLFFSNNEIKQLEQFLNNILLDSLSKELTKL